MGKFADNIGGGITFLMYLVFITLWGLGIYHSFDKHTDGVLSVFLFPWSIYRGAEMFWHDDFADVDWDKRLQSDIKICLFFMNNVDNKEYSTFKYNQEIEEFSKSISKYPQDKRDYLKKATKSYYEYSMSAIQDVISYIMNTKTDNKSKFNISNNTKKLEDEFSKYISNEDFGIMKSSLNTYMDTFSSAIEEEENKMQYSEIYDLFVKKTDINYKTAYKNIFNEELD